ncbi:MAG: efflux RND transporter periplasmic adaptor subunit [Pseudomonadales bacterium]
MLALNVTLLLSGCGASEAPVVADQSVRPARIFAVGAETRTETHAFVGRVEAAQTIDLTFRVPGLLTALPVLEGQAVRADDLVAAIDPTDYQLALREAQVQRELARQDLARKRKLLDERGISQSTVDEAQALFELREVTVAQASENLERTRLRAPWDAFVARRYLDNHVNVRVGDPIVRLSDLTELYIIANVPETLIATVTPERVIGMHAHFGFVPEQRFELSFRENSGESDAVAQTFEITFAMPRPEGWNILPGMTATVEIELTAPDAAEELQIPTSALVTDPQKKYFVWVYDDATHAVARRPVTVGPAAGAGISVRSGLEPGELIVASGAASLQPGMRVRMLGTPVTELQRDER